MKEAETKVRAFETKRHVRVWSVGWNVDGTGFRLILMISV